MPTVKRDDGSDRQQVHFKVESKKKVDEKGTSARPEKELSGSTTSTDRVVKTQAEFIDMRIKDSVAAGFLALQANWKRLSKKFIHVEEQIVSMRVDVQKNNLIGSQL